MKFAITSFLLIFVAMNVGYLFLTHRALRRDDRLRALRLARRDKPNVSASQHAAAALLRRDKPETSHTIKELIARIHSDERLGSLLEISGMHYTAAGFLRTSFASAMVGGVVCLWFAPLSMAILAIPVAIVCALVPTCFLRHRVHLRIGAFEEQFPEGLEFVSRSMRAGHAFSVSLELLYREFDDPMAKEFRRIFEEQNLGMPLETALARFSSRVPLLDVQFFTSAVLLQRKTGGNLTEILDKLAQLIRDRSKLRGKIKAVSAHGRMTGKVLCAIPLFVAAVMFYSNRTYTEFFLHTLLGREMLSGALGMQLLGYLVVRKIVNIEV